jgi:hypothetical protein
MLLLDRIIQSLFVTTGFAITNRNLVSVGHEAAVIVHEAQQSQLAQFTEICLTLFEAGTLAGSHGNRSMPFPESFGP